MKLGVLVFFEYLTWRENKIKNKWRKDGQPFQKKEEIG
jgi:hypothetical protein